MTGTPLIALFLLQAYPALLPACTATDSLTVRNGHAMAYHPGQGAVVLFGGADERRVLADLWAWDGREWRCLSNGGPPPRTFPALAYDGAGERLILFGGNRVLFGAEADTTGTFLDDMWAWADGEWRRLEGTMPPARAEAGIAYDSARQRVVLFGGYRIDNGETMRLGDTWEWDGTAWERRSTGGPSPRNGAVMAYDTHRGRVVLFGGSGGPSDQTWEWDGTAWERIDAAQTPGRFNSAMAYDTSRRTMLRFGGWNGERRVNGTWSYDAPAWRRLEATGPAARNHTMLVYDPGRETMVLFGGHDGPRVFGDTWEWDGRTWTQRGGQAPRLRIENGH